MRLEENTIAEQIARLALIRTGLVSVREDRDHRFECDMVVYNKNQPSKVLLVEVKQMSGNNISKETIYERHRSFINSITKKSCENPYIVFFIEGVSEKGYFEIFNEGRGQGLEKLRMDFLSSRLSILLGELTKLEYPPYSFYQKDGDGRYKTKRILIDNEYRFLRLINLTISPFEIISNITIEVVVQKGLESKKKTFHLDRLFHNPNLHNFLFFIDPVTRREIGEIPLPPGNKYVYIQVKSDAGIRQDFEMKLSCRYLRHLGEPNY